MCFKWLKKKNQKPAEVPQQRPEEPITKSVQATPPEPVVTEPVQAPAPKETVPPPVEKEPEAKLEPAPSPVKKEPEKPTAPIAAPETLAPAATTPTPEKQETRYMGKYEVFPEAGFFKYRLKASNGEILIVSQGYVSKTGAVSGIETLKRNIATGNFEIYTDKNNFSQFLLNSSTGRRLIAVGEFYDSPKRCESAIESVKRFYSTEKIVTLEKIPPEEIREEVVEIKPVEKNANGKFEVFLEKEEWLFRLKAANSEVLMVGQGYSSKPSCLAGLETIRNAVLNANFRISKDKQGRFQFKLYSTNNQLLLTGETYMDKDNCMNAILAVRKYTPDAKTVELK
jgi:hypothetical protein